MISIAIYVQTRRFFYVVSILYSLLCTIHMTLKTDDVIRTSIVILQTYAMPLCSQLSGEIEYQR